MVRAKKKGGKKAAEEISQALEQLSVEPSTSRASSETSQPGPSHPSETKPAQPSESAQAAETPQSTEVVQSKEAEPPKEGAPSTEDGGAQVAVRKRVRNRKKPFKDSQVEKKSGQESEQTTDPPAPASTAPAPASTEPAPDLNAPPSFWARSSTAQAAPSMGRGRGRGVPPFSSGPSTSVPVQPVTAAPTVPSWFKDFSAPSRSQAIQGSGDGSWVQQQGPPQQARPHQQPSWSQQGPSQQQGPPQQAGTQQQPSWSQQGPPQQAGPQQQPSWFDQGPSQQQGPPQQRGPPQQQGPPQQRGPPQQQRPPQQSRPEDKTVAVPAKRSSIYSIPAKIVKNTVQGVRNKAVLTNYLPLTIKPIICYRYDVAFNPEKPKKLLPRAFYAVLLRDFPKTIVAYDQVKIMFTVQPLKGISEERKSFKTKIHDDNDKEMAFEVAIKAAGTVDLSSIFQYMKNGTTLQAPTDAIQCVDVVLRQGTLLNYKKAGRAFFKQPSRPVDLGEGLEMWTGLFQSAIFGSRPFINIDVAHKGFPISKSLIEHLRDFKLDPSQPLDRQRGVQPFRAFLKGLRVIVNVGGDTSKECRREFIINDIKEPADEIKFSYTDQNTGASKQMTVDAYFRVDKKYRLKFPRLNVIWVGSRNKCIYYPMELATVVHGQLLNRKMTERQVSTMVRQAATAPSIRKAKIEELIHSMNYSKNEYYNHFGLSISEQFTKVDSKIIPPPKLDYGGQSVEPRNGQWNFRKLLKGMNLVQWGFVGVNVDDRSSNSAVSIKTFRSVANDIGMMMAEPAIVGFIRHPNELDKVMYEAVEKKLQLLMVVVPQWSMKEVYHKVKFTAERRIGVLTQCVKDSTLQRINVQTARNILLKVNSKLMGINQAISGRSLPQCLQSGRVMVVGADVTHSTPDQSHIPSIAAVTASIDAHCYQYNINLSIQSPKQEIIVEFEDLMLEHLKIYRDNMKCLPIKIYVFRDGVSEGQFEQVMNSELRAVYNAYSTLTGGKGKPEVLFLLVQKRHHTRMFTTDAEARNVEPGTVIDTDIVHPREIDFYLVSHQAIKGTARPTRYHAICNDGNLPMDQIEQLAHYLCHLYSRCARSVSYPTPTYYAHLACLRARVLTQNEQFDNAQLEKKPKRLQVLDKLLVNSRMFFV